MDNSAGSAHTAIPLPPMQREAFNFFFRKRRGSEKESTIDVSNPIGD
jgi:hypothetical protein